MEFFFFFYYYKKIKSQIPKITHEMNSEEHFEEISKNARIVNTRISSVMESTSPFYTPKERERMGIDQTYGGITGTIIPSSFMRFFKSLQNNEELKVKQDESVFCDVGSGMGRPSLTAALFPFKLCLGFDIDEVQVQNSFNAQAATSKIDTSVIMSPVKFLHQDVRTLASLDPSTHVYAFVGFSGMIYEIARLIAQSITPKVLCIVVVKTDGLIGSGLFADGDTGVVVLKGMKMSSGRSYTGFLIPISDALKERIKTSLQSHEWESGNQPSDVLNISLKTPEGAARPEKRQRRSCARKLVF